MARRIDLNAARAARAEARGEPVTVELGDDVYELPAEMPASVIGCIARAQAGDPSGMLEAMAALVGDGFDEMVTKHRLSLDDLMVLLDGASEQYGMTTPESSASPASSPATSTPSRPTSSATTTPTSARPSSAPARS